jgi:hypothetical protein
LEPARYLWRVDEVNSKGVTTGTTWIVSTELPTTNPNPPDGTVVTDADPVLSWEGDPNAASFSVYLGKESPGTFRTTQTATTFAPGHLAHGTYYWRVDQRHSSFGYSIRGNVWTFTIPHPATAINVYPPDGATEIHPDQDGTYFLEWQAGKDAESHNVYFGTASPGDFQGNQSETKFSLGRRITPGKYYWRIDEVGTEGTVEGTVWTFTVFSPGQATDPDPPEGAIGVKTSALLTWTPGEGATSHNVYLGTESPGTFQGTVTDPMFSRSMLSYTKYYWRIDEVGPAGTVEGMVWTFTTGPGSR